jgi:tetratricopeptide (TPR) repeat protein
MATDTFPVERRDIWIMSPLADSLFMIGAPLFIVPLLWGFSELLSPVLVGGFVLTVLSAGHHLPGFLRAYGDPVLFARYRVRFLLMPPLVFAAMLWFTWNDLLGGVLVAAVWGIWHGLMQVYGFMRIYDAKNGEVARATSRLDWWMCFIGFAVILVWSESAAAPILAASDGSGLLFMPLLFGETARQVTAVLGIGMGIVYVGYTVVKLRQGRPIAPLKLILLAMSLGFLYFSWILAGSTLILGLAAFEAFHDIQYFAITWAYNRRMVAKGRGSAALRRLFRPGVWLIALYVTMILAYGGMLSMKGFFTGHVITSVLFAALLTSAILHFYFDGFIWKVSQAKTRADLDIPVAQGAAAATSPQPLGMPSRSRAYEYAQFAFMGVPLGALILLGMYREQVELPMREVMVRVAPESSEHRLRLGTTYMTQQRYNDAIAQYRAALSIEPSLDVAYQSVAVSLVAQGRMSDAIVAYRQALAAAPDSKPSSLALSELLLARGRESEAVAVLREARTHAPVDVELSSALALALLEGPADPAQISEATELARRTVMATSSQHPKSLIALASALAAQERFDRAVHFLERAQQTEAAKRDPAVAGEIDGLLDRYRAELDRS